MPFTKWNFIQDLSTQLFEPPHDKTNKWHVRPAKTQISLGIRPVWSESSLFAWRKHGSLATHWVHSEDSDQTGRMSQRWDARLIWANILKLLWTVYGPRQANLVLIAYASSEGSGEPAHPRSLARTFAARSYKQWIKRNLQTESQISSPSEWLGMRS